MKLNQPASFGPPQGDRSRQSAACSHGEKSIRFGQTTGRDQRMNRRELFMTLAGAVAPWPSTAQAQQTRPRPLIGGVLLPALSTRQHLVDALRDGLQQNGLIIGRNIDFAIYSAD